MSRRWALGALGLVAAAGAVAQAQNSAPRGAQTAAELAAGKQSYAKWCAPCHAPRPGLAGTLALRTKYNGELPPALEDRTDLTPETVEYFVRNGVAWMAPFRKTEISDTELAAIGAYLSAPIARRGPYAELLAEEMHRTRGGAQ